MNPIKEARLNAGMSQKELAALSNMSTHAVLRYEQGLYENLSNNLLMTLSDHLGLSADEHKLMLQAYDNFRLETQRAAAPLMEHPSPIQINVDFHPFVAFREHITMRAVGKANRMRFCILLALNPAVVLNYESGKQGPMPALIKAGLTNAKLDKGYLEMLEIYGQIWHERYGC